MPYIYKFFVKCLGRNIPVSEPTLQRKASENPLRKHVEILQAREEWFGLFRRRHNIKCRLCLVS